MRGGAQYKVYSTIFNILQQVTLIQDTRVGHRFSEHCTPREAIETYRDTALISVATLQPLPHMYVSSSPRTQGSSRQASRTPSPVANASRCTTQLSHAATTTGRSGQGRQIAARPRPCKAQHRPRRRQRPHRRLPASRRVGHQAAGHQAAAATICSESSQSLWRSVVGWMSASAAVTGWVRYQ